MPQVCGQCSRVNPQDAVYCYFDGISLAGRGGGPLQAGSQLFPTPFVFPNGASSRSFDQLALTCQQHWPQAVDLLKQGYLGSFFGGMGRVDLAMAAQDAAKYPDADRGLDQLLAKLPTQALQAPRLQVEPTIVNLGQIKIGDDRQAELHLSNLGMRLLYGSIASTDKWLQLGDAPGLPQKVFQFGTEATIPLQVRGQHLRAGLKPLEAKLAVDSNGGTAEIIIRADVPPAPFEGPILQGALSPRQVAEKAKANPAGAAPLFEKGDVSKWFAKNGWTYPVKGPSASGLGAVQQFFEALGLAKAPKVKINVKEIALTGDPGQVLTQNIEVTTEEKKPVYAYAVGEQPWIDGTKVKLAGRTATITVTITVPNRPGEKIDTKLTVHGNGNQRFPVPLKLTITGEPLAFSPVDADEPMFVPDAANAGPLVPEPVFTPAGAGVDASSFEFEAAAPVQPKVSSSPTPAAPTATTAPAPARSNRQGIPWWAHSIPAFLLLLVLGGTLVRDLFLPPPSQAGDPVEREPRIGVTFDYAFNPGDKAGKSMTFGIQAYEPGKGKAAGATNLTFAFNGSTNSAMAMVDRKPFVFGDVQFGRPPERPQSSGKYGGYSTTYRHTNSRVAITQIVEIVPGNPIEISGGEFVRPLDTCLVRYVLENEDAKEHTVGFRFVLDTYIGNNDGVPFAVPGKAELVKSADFDGASQVPDYIQAIESPELRSPGIIAQLNLRLNEKYEAPSRVVLTEWNLDLQKKFELPFETKAKGKKFVVPPIGKDSAVVMCWDEKPLPRGGKRTLAFSYGVGNLSTSAGIGILNPGSVVAGREFALTAVVQDPTPNQKLGIQVPEGFRLADSTPAMQPVPQGEKGRPSPVTWRLTPATTGRFPIRVSTSEGLTTERKISVSRVPLF
ncbi:MAG: hypothetical protein K2X38_14750 [Gemmataceae bacterium]|nr:hypothetical protein [Gemmataceae bacterium]